MSILLGLLGGEVLCSVVIFVVFFATFVNFLPEIIITILLILSYIIIFSILVFGILLTKNNDSNTKKIYGIFTIIFSVFSFFALISRNEISNYINENRINKEIELINSAKSHICFENLCKTEEIVCIEILYTENSEVNISKKSRKYSGWSQLWSSTMEEIKLSLDNLPLKENDKKFTLRVTTKDKKETVIREGCIPQYVYHKIHFEKKDIDPFGEQFIKIIYNGTGLIVKNDTVLINENSFFSENMQIIFEEPNLGINTSSLNIFTQKEISEDMKEIESFKRVIGRIQNPYEKISSEYNNNNSSNRYMCLSKDGFPYNITMKKIIPNDEVTVIYRFYRDGKEQSVETTFIAKELNQITIKNDDTVHISYEPNLYKFDFIKVPLGSM